MEEWYNRYMEERTRKPFEGITNIIRFNWHYYIISFVAAIVLIVVSRYVSGYTVVLILVVFWLMLIGTLLSLAVSFYVYDISPLYTLNWLPSLPIKKDLQLVNINAGFDETSYLLSKKYPHAKLRVLDFYNAKQHTEVSIARAQKRYPSFAGTLSVSTSLLLLQNESSDAIFAILSAHEIRDRKERILFFSQLKHALQESGTIVVTEHLRDAANFIAYNIGFFHFFSKQEWKHTFYEAGLHIVNETSVTPFIHVFFLQKHGTVL